MDSFLTKEEYVLNKVKLLNMEYLFKKDNIDPYMLYELIKQWEFDYKMEREYRPEVLIKEKGEVI